MAHFHTTEAPFRFRRGRTPLLISFPHVGAHVPECVASRLSRAGVEVHDTDWHLEQLYAFADTLGASMLVATHSRYVIDLNRPPDGASLYPGQSVTGLCPIDTFDDTPLYTRGEAPDAAEVAQRREQVWLPYHAQLEAELQRLRAEHGVALLWDAHSIRSVLPRFFEGKLPDLNLGTADGASCDPALAQRLLAVAQGAPGHTAVLNGRFKGGHITRHYGRPAQGFHAVQLEMTQSSYMDEAMPFAYRPDLAAQIQPTLQQLIETMLAFGRAA
ncbi:N-formylglutamate deformylase [Curvibacter sp. HBC61]|uniref:N-formylglutamate deformylase n=1 Tax=Curvibacter cyanobacteriorum TaxID=3026422 RepID=A0ABT5MXK2_9BURK|nr:N-formylglutamate deformylase [Curvibacter sp. HBC61]MDD0838074.1 N-formylglutamate deformylase [Curvibacter sp. HBC61]